jgi:chromosomal replication initiator protein
MMSGRKIDLEFVGEVLANILRATSAASRSTRSRPGCRTITASARPEMTSARRAREVARPRQVAMYLAS